MLNDKAYGDIEARSGGEVRRGPLECVEVITDLVKFVPKWLAVTTWTSPSGKARWTLCTEQSPCYIIIKKLFEPIDIGAGRVCFQIPDRGAAIVFPKDGDALDPRQVEGHELYDPDFIPAPREG